MGHAARRAVAAAAAARRRLITGARWLAAAGLVATAAGSRNALRSVAAAAAMPGPRRLGSSAAVASSEPAPVVGGRGAHCTGRRALADRACGGAGSGRGARCRRAQAESPGKGTVAVGATVAAVALAGGRGAIAVGDGASATGAPLTRSGQPLATRGNVASVFGNAELLESLVLHAAAGRAAEAEVFLEELLGREPQIEDPKLPLASTHYVSVAVAFARRGDLSSADRWLDQMLRAHGALGVPEFTALIEAFVRADARAVGEEHLWRLFEKLVVAGVEPDAAAYSTVICSYSQEGQHDAALHWLWRAKAAGVVPEPRAFRALVRGLAGMGRTEIAGRAYAELAGQLRMQGRAPDAQSCSDLMKAYADKNDTTQATGLLESATSEGLRLEVSAFTAVMDANVRAGDRAGTERCCRAIVQADVKPRDRQDFQTVLNACSHVGDVRRATMWFDQLIGAGFQPEEATYGLIFKACAMASPKEKKVAEKFLCAAVATGVMLSWRSVVQLDRVLGVVMRHQLFEVLGLDNEGPDREIKSNRHDPAAAGAEAGSTEATAADEAATPRHREASPRRRNGWRPPRRAPQRRPSQSQQPTQRMAWGSRRVLRERSSQ
mmetsp:Transcript_35207/g.79550  ORF Transcript_35207/g.79550 Transcript_35207/m.79550 type:complete len:607 (-) Transcript_35207:105-1925(-)